MSFKDYIKEGSNTLLVETSSEGFKEILLKNLDKDIVFGEKHKKSDRKYWEGALDVLYDYKKIVEGL